MIKIIYCFNQISYVIAHEVAEKSEGKTLLIIDATRISPYIGSKVRTLRLNALISFFVLISSIIYSGIEVVIPHAKCVRFTRQMSRYSKNLAYIDDGMDTFREMPKNINLQELRLGAKYYTFEYNIQLAEWVSVLRVVPVCSLKNLENDPKPALDLTSYNYLVIESPGVCIGKYDNSKVFCIKHPSHVKNQKIEFINSQESGLNCSVEKTIKNFDGNIVIGESMVLVYALNFLSDLSRITVSLNESQFKNLKSLHKVLAKCQCEFVLESV